jgi:hypothetical protein
MDQTTYDKLADFLDDFDKEHLIKELIHLLKYESVVDILEQVEEYDNQTAAEQKENNNE